MPALKDQNARPADENIAGWPGLCATGRRQGRALSCDIREVDMTDMLIRDVPDDVIAALDAHAGRLGLSRSEYVRRRLAQDAARPGSPVSVEDLARFTEVFGDLADPDVMSQAWR
jgi:plasmid stability protein